MKPGDKVKYILTDYSNKPYKPKEYDATVIANDGISIKARLVNKHGIVHIIKRPIKHFRA